MGSVPRACGEAETSTIGRSIFNRDQGIELLRSRFRIKSTQDLKSGIVQIGGPGAVQFMCISQAT